LIFRVRDSFHPKYIRTGSRTFFSKILASRNHNCERLTNN
jgi:hypothetical protein